jgi:NitT/TauT family transport system substrate-binding protein
MREPARAARLGIAVLIVLLVAAGCSGGGPSNAPIQLKVGLGFTPSVQFAQFYLADQAGYYRDVGLDVELVNKIDPELITLVGQGAVDIALADGTSVVPAVSQGIPIRYGATIYADFPNVVFAPTSKGIATAADLKGRRVGTPGRYGSSWIMLQALLGGAGLTPDDVTLDPPFPDFSQRACVERGECDAATGFANNEPVVMAQDGPAPTVLSVDDVVALQGNGLIVGEETLAVKGDALRRFVEATLRAERDIIADPEKGLEAAIVRIPELASDRETQLAVLEATIAMWQDEVTAASGLGALDRPGWQAMVDFMAGLPDSPVAKPVTVDELLTDELLAPP